MRNILVFPYFYPQNHVFIGIVIDYFLKCPKYKEFFPVL